MTADATRREFVRALLGGVAGLTVTLPAFAQGRGGQEPAPITATKLTDRMAASPTKEFDMALGVQNPQGFLSQAYGGVLAKR